MPRYSGSCHCGAVTFTIDAEITELTTCDCSLCVKKNALMTKVPEGVLTILTGADAQSLYQWNTQRAKHYFCATCGIYTFHRKRAAPDHFGVNVHCLDGFDPTSVPVRRTAGADMTVVSADPRPEWPGPRVAG
ncbi:MAG TPA: GFA family protein [Sphingobium sp.]